MDHNLWALLPVTITRVIQLSCSQSLGSTFGDRHLLPFERPWNNRMSDKITPVDVSTLQGGCTADLREALLQGRFSPGKDGDDPRPCGGARHWRHAGSRGPAATGCGKGAGAVAQPTSRSPSPEMFSELIRIRMTIEGMAASRRASPEPASGRPARADQRGINVYVSRGFSILC